jgi:hypothetical protein
MKFSRKSSKNRKTAKRSTKRNYKKKRGGGFNVYRCVNGKKENDEKLSDNDVRKYCYALNNEYISKIKTEDDTEKQIIELKANQEELNDKIIRLETEQEELMAEKKKQELEKAQASYERKQKELQQEKLKQYRLKPLGLAPKNDDDDDD